MKLFRTSALLALALAAVPVDGRADGAPERWLDLCAGPGGKAGLLEAIFNDSWASLNQHAPAFLEGSAHGRDAIIRSLALHIDESEGEVATR